MSELHLTYEHYHREKEKADAKENDRMSFNKNGGASKASTSDGFVRINDSFQLSSVSDIKLMSKKR